MSYQLLQLIPTAICPVGKPRLCCNKWRVLDEDGTPVTTLQGRGIRFYKEHAEETAMLHVLRKEFREYEIISIPDPHHLTHCLYEARQYVLLLPKNAEPAVTPSAAKPATARTGTMF